MEGTVVNNKKLVGTLSSGGSMVGGMATVYGKDGKDGTDGVDGKSAYEIALANGFEGTETEWLESIRGKDGHTPVKGVDYFDGKDGEDGYTPVKGVDYFDGKDGVDGKDGTMTFEELTDEQKESLRGEKGDTGNSGVYIGSGDMPEDCNVQIDPNGEALTDDYLESSLSTLGQLATVRYLKRTSGAQVHYAYNFVAGNRYKVTNTADVQVIVRTKDDLNGAGNDVNIQNESGNWVANITLNKKGDTTTFVAGEGAVSLYLYFGSGGSATFEDLSMRVPIMEERVKKLQVEISPLMDVLHIEKPTDKQGITYKHNFISGHKYRITSNAYRNVGASTKDSNGNTIKMINESGEEVDSINLPDTWDTAIFTAKEGAVALYLYFTDNGSVTLEDVSFYVPAVEERVTNIERQGALSEFAWSLGSIKRAKWECGRDDNTTTNHIRSGFIPVTGYKNTVIYNSNGCSFLVFEYASNSELSCLREKMTDDVWSTDKYTIKNDACKYVRILVKKSNGTDFALTPNNEIESYGNCFELTQTSFANRSVGRYVSPVKEDFVYTGGLEDWSRACPTEPTRLQQLYAKWEALREANTNIISKTVLGTVNVIVTERDKDGKVVTDGSGNPIVKTVAEEIRSYRITPTPLMWSNRIARYCCEPLKILYVSGIHSGEGCIAVDDFVMFKNLVENHKPSVLWDNCVFEVIPVANPFGYDNYTRTNGNGVNINRNFPVGWVYAEDSYNASGAEAFDQYETQVLRDFVKANPDAFLVLNRHSTSRWGVANPKVGYATSSYQSDIETAIASCMSTDSVLRKVDAWKDIIEGVSPDNRILNVMHSDMFDGSFDRWFHSMGYHGYLLEYTDRFESDAGIANNGKNSDGKSNYTHPDVRKISITAIANLLCDSVLNNRDILVNNNLLPDREMTP